MPTVSAFGWLLIVLVLFIPPASIAGIVVWARRLSKSRRLPRLAGGVVYGLAAVGGLAIVGGIVLAYVSSTSAVSGESVDPSEKARHLAEGISELMNCDALAMLVAGAATWILVWRWRKGRS